MPKFNDSENKTFTILPEGDYVFRVIGFEVGISKGGKTAGSDTYEVEVIFEGTGGRCWENLIDHPLTDWKIDTFLKSANVSLKAGTGFEFTAERARSNGVPFVNPYGLRGHCRVAVDEYNGKKRNKISIFYTDKPKLARHIPDPDAAAQGPAVEVPAVDEDDIPF